MAHTIVQQAEAAFVTETDLVTNGAFAADTDWAKGTGATIAAGVLHYDGTQAGNSITDQASSVFSAGDLIICSFVVSGLTAGQVRLRIGSAVSEWFDANGTYDRISLIPTDTTDLGIEADVNFVGDVDDLVMMWPHGRYDELTNNSRNQIPTRNQYQLPASALAIDDDFKVVADVGELLSFDRDTDVSGAVEPLAGSGAGIFTPDQHFDYHFRLWVIPTTLSLSNPQVGVNIGFDLWNTWTDVETIVSITPVGEGAAALSWDIGTGTELHDGEYRAVNMQIGGGEPVINALVTFVTENLSAVQQVLAIVSDTFNLIPDVPVKEIWEWKTDVITNFRGTEQRVALRRFPRNTQQYTVEIIDTRQRREQMTLVRKNIVLQSLVPIHQYATNLTQSSVAGATRIFFDPERTNIRVGEFVIIIDPVTEAKNVAKINVIETDGATLNSSLGQDITPNWVIAPGYNCILNDGTGVNMNMIAGELRVKAESLSETTLIRPGDPTTLTTLNSIPVLERRPLAGAKEQYSHERTVIDNESGAREMSTGALHPVIRGTRKFTIQRSDDPLDMDYWRTFMDTARGAQKSFLLSTYFPDLTLDAPLVQNGSAMTVEQGDYVDLYFPFEAWKYIEFEFPGRLMSRHQVLTAISQPDGTAILSFTPALPDDPDYAVTPDRISFLNRVRADDKVVISHFALYSELSITIRTSDS